MESEGDLDISEGWKIELFDAADTARRIWGEADWKELFPDQPDVNWRIRLTSRMGVDYILPVTATAAHIAAVIERENGKELGLKFESE